MRLLVIFAAFALGACAHQAPSASNPGPAVMARKAPVASAPTVVSPSPAAAAIQASQPAPAKLTRRQKVLRFLHLKKD